MNYPKIRLLNGPVSFLYVLVGAGRTGRLGRKGTVVMNNTHTDANKLIERGVCCLFLFCGRILS